MECSKCHRKFNRRDNLRRHVKNSCKKQTGQQRNKRQGEKYCNFCKKNVPRNEWSGHLRTNTHKNNSSSRHSEGVEIINSAFQERIISYRIQSLEMCVNIIEFFKNYSPKITHILEKEIAKHTCVKFNMELFGYYFCETSQLHTVKSFNTSFQIVCSSTDMGEILTEMIAVIDRKADEMAERESGTKSFYQTIRVICRC
jgi:hypothetical protein